MAGPSRLRVVMAQSCQRLAKTTNEKASMKMKDHAHTKKNDNQCLIAYVAWRIELELTLASR